MEPRILSLGRNLDVLSLPQSSSQVPARDETRFVVKKASEEVKANPRKTLQKRKLGNKEVVNQS